MNVPVFPVGTTNIFPLANSTRGGQLMTEYNLKSRESVATDSSVKYRIGPSFVHSEDDFKVTPQTDGAGVVVSSSALQIAPGIGVIDGHYVESLVPVVVDLAAMNMELSKYSMPALRGELCVGLRIMYSTEQTMAGAMKVESDDGVYEGIHLVVENREDFKLPKDVPTEPDKVTAHIKLADVIYRNGTVSAKTITNNYPAKCQIISAERVGNADMMLSDIYLRKTGLNPGDLYVFAGKGTDNRLDTWCKSTDSLMVFDPAPERDIKEPLFNTSQFIADLDDRVKFVLAHKQVDGFTNLAGQKVYLQNKVLSLPKADYDKGTAGTVDARYTNRIKNIGEQLNNIYRLPNGKQVGYLSDLDEPRNESLPPLNPKWKIGDYIVVRYDSTTSEREPGISDPATMYIVLPGAVQSVEYAGQSDSRTGSGLTGIEISYEEWNTSTAPPDTEDPEVYNTYWTWDYVYRGDIGNDYFTIRYQQVDEENPDAPPKYMYYFYKVASATSRVYSDPVTITGSVPLAQEEQIGGFLNIPETEIDAGYVRRTDTGHLQLVDYALLRSGTLAYQLGQDVTIPSNLDAEGTQSLIDEYINERIAFPNAQHIATATHPNLININLELSASDEPMNLTIRDIDSRFGTAVCINITGDAGNNVTINVLDCQRVKINPVVGGTPVINIHRCCLWYDSVVLDYVKDISGLTLWYERFQETDPNLTLNGMTLRTNDGPVIPTDLDYWSLDTPNDNHYMFALQSITLDSTGTIVGFGLYVKNESSMNISLDSEITVSAFTLPQGTTLTYPSTRLKSQLKVTGSFVTCYYSTADNGYITITTNFTALTNAYGGSIEAGLNIQGTISFLSDAKFIRIANGITNGQNIDGWESGSYHIFYGGVVS